MDDTRTPSAELGHRTVTLCHGDELCTDDLEYQAFRRYARDPDNQQRFLSQTLQARAEEAMRLKMASREAMQLKADDIMDVNDGAVRQLISARYRHPDSWSHASPRGSQAVVRQPYSGASRAR